MFKFKLRTAVKLINRIMAVIFVLFWGMIALGLGQSFIERNYIYPIKYKEIILDSADYYGLDRALVFSVVKVESGFDKNAKSNAGAIGLMQITERTGDYIAGLMKIEQYDLSDEQTNLWFGCFYLKYLLDKFKVTDTALCAYNAGEGNVAIWLTNSEYTKDGQTLDLIPFRETEQYVEKIHATYEKYKKLYENILDKH